MKTSIYLLAILLLLLVISCTDTIVQPVEEALLIRDTIWMPPDTIIVVDSIFVPPDTIIVRDTLYVITAWAYSIYSGREWTELWHENTYCWGGTTGDSVCLLKPHGKVF